MKKQFPHLISLGLLILLLVYWQFLSNAKESFELGGAIPPPSIIWECFLELTKEGRLQASIIDSLWRFGVGLFLGGFLAIILGLFFGRFKIIHNVFEPFIQLFRPISPIAWLPIIVFLLGIGEWGAIFVIVYAVFFPVLLLTITGVREINATLLLMAENFNAKEMLIFRKIILPGAFLHIASGLKLAASIAWIHLVAGEMLGIQSGLGYLIIDGRNLMRMDMVIVAMIWIGILGLCITIVFSFIEKCIRKFLGERQ